jgi:FkbM family methyltransferase
MESAVLKDLIRKALPKPAAYLAHAKALFENEVELRLLPWLCNAREVAIDVGAFTGTYSVGLSIYSRRVIAIEPQPWQADALRRAMPRNVTIVEAALSDVAGSAIMKLSSPGGGSMSTLDARAPIRNWPELSVSIIRLDDLHDERIGFIKIDVEGHERKVLAGAQSILQRDKPNLLVEAEERNEAGSVERLVGMLQSGGYDAYFVRNNRVLPICEFKSERDQDPKLLVGGQRRAYRDYINNFLFIHSERQTRMPDHVPASTRACLETIRRFFGGKPV